MKDTRTIQNTSQEEILNILDKAKAKKDKSWKKPKLCAAPECKTLFTPGREWQIYCSIGCQRAMNILKKQAADNRIYAEFARLDKENQLLQEEVARLTLENKQLKEAK